MTHDESQNTIRRRQKFVIRSQHFYVNSAFVKFLREKKIAVDQNV